MWKLGCLSGTVKWTIAIGHNRYIDIGATTTQARHVSSRNRQTKKNHKKLSSSEADFTLIVLNFDFVSSPAVIVFAVVGVVMVTVSLFTKKIPRDQLGGLTWSTIDEPPLAQSPTDMQIVRAGKLSGQEAQENIVLNEKEKETGRVHNLVHFPLLSSVKLIKEVETLFSMKFQKSAIIHFFYNAIFEILNLVTVFLK